jgi:hypothetical protein
MQASDIRSCPASIPEPLAELSCPKQRSAPFHPGDLLHGPNGETVDQVLAQLRPLARRKDHSSGMLALRLMDLEVDLFDDLTAEPDDITEPPTAVGQARGLKVRVEDAETFRAMTILGGRTPFMARARNVRHPPIAAVETSAQPPSGIPSF